MNTLHKILITTFAVMSLQVSANSGASQNTSAASKHSALAVAHGSKASTQVASAVIATPLLVVGAVGHVSLKAGTALMEHAVTNEPLEITPKTITVAPSPKQVMLLNE